MIKYFNGDDKKFLIFNIEKDDPQMLARFLNLEKITFGHKNENTRNPANHTSDLPSAIYA